MAAYSFVVAACSEIGGPKLLELLLGIRDETVWQRPYLAHPFLQDQSPGRGIGK